MKKILLALTMVALAASLAFGAYSNAGYEEITGTETVTITGAPAGNLSIAAITGDCTFTYTNGPSGQGATFTVRAGQAITLTGINLYSFTATATLADAVWW